MRSYRRDIFINRFEQCHVLNLENRLDLNDLTLPQADLLLTKLQIHQLNAKDVLDIFTLLLDHVVEYHEAADGRAPDEIDLNFICHLTGEDWGWYTSVHDNLAVLETLLPEHLTGEDLLLVRTRLEKLRGAIESQSKTFRWQARNFIGRRLNALSQRMPQAVLSIYNTHLPPKDTPIDQAARLDATFKPIVQGGQVVMTGVGSSSVCEAILKYQPALGLHGHVHEAPGAIRLGMTVCINPGSEYSDGILRGALITLDEKKKTLNYQLIMG